MKSLQNCRFLSAALLLSLFVASAHSADLVVYSGRSERLIKPVLDRFTLETSLKITLHSAGTVELFNKLVMEGERSPADVYLTVDAGTLERARIAGLLHPLNSESIKTNVPPKMRAPDLSWIGLSVRMRVIAINPSRLTPSEVRSFEDLTAPRFKGRLGLRTGSNVYVQSHIALMMAEDGEAAAEKTVRGWLANAGNKIYPSDARAVEAVAKGEVDAAIVNHYYVYAHLAKNPQDAQTLAFHAPNGTAANISGGAVLKTSRNKESALRLLEFLASEEGQRMFSDENWEYPVHPGIPPHPSLLARDQFSLSPTSLAGMGRFVVPAIDLIDRVGYR